MGDERVKLDGDLTRVKDALSAVEEAWEVAEEARRKAEYEAAQLEVDCARPEKFQFLEKGQNRNFDYKIVISVKNS